MDAEKIAQIASLMEEHGLTRMRVEEADGTVVEVERGPRPPHPGEGPCGPGPEDADGHPRPPMPPAQPWGPAPQPWGMMPQQPWGPGPQQPWGPAPQAGMPAQPWYGQGADGMPVSPAVTPQASVEAQPVEAPQAAEPAMDMSRATAVSAPMVGVFYAAPSPGAEPFVQVGSKVKAGDTLCVIEAMKVMNEVVAECDGEVVDICVKDGELVEYGCCLMKIY